MSSEADLASSGVVLFTTPGCPHCPRVRQTSLDVAQRRPGVKFSEVSAVDRPDLVKSMNVRAAPTMLALRDGVEVGRTIGASSADEIERLFEASAGGPAVARRSVSTEDRTIRSAAGAVLLLAGLITQIIWLALFGVGLLLWGWYDYLSPNASLTS